MSMSIAKELAFRAEGSGFPILIVHGWQMNGQVEAHDFEPIFSNLPVSQQYRRIYIDLPDHGASRFNTSTDMDTILSHVISFVEKHILPSRFLVTGQSAGGYLARAVAYRFADSVDGLMLKVPLVNAGKANRDIDPFKPLIANPSLVSELASGDRQMSASLGDIPIQTPEYIEILKGKANATWIPAAEISNKAVLQPIRTDPEKYVLRAKMHTKDERFAKPSLIVVGRQDTAVGWKDAIKLIEVYERATLAIMDRATHALPVGEGERDVFAALVSEWLKRVEEARQGSV